MPDDLIGQAIITAAFVLAAALIWCVRTWAETRKHLALLNPPDPHTDQEHPHD